MIERYEEEKTVDEHTAPLSVEEELKREEEKLAEEKPVDANSEIVPNKNLTDDEIAQLILEEEELLSDQGLLGYICTIVESIDSDGVMHYQYSFFHFFLKSIRFSNN